MVTAAYQGAQIRPQPEFAEILKEDTAFASGDTTDFSNRINGSFDQMMRQSGLDMDPSVIILLCLLATLTVGGAFFVMQENLLTTAVGAGLGFILPFAALAGIRMQRQRQMSRQIPPMIDELARAAKTGRSVEQCLQMVADDTPDPLGAELKYCQQRMELGVDLAEALRELPDRTGLVALNILVTALAVHQQTGGDLVSVLERLSQTMRDRLLFLGRLRAATIGSRATAILMLVLPVGIITFFVFRDPNYLSDLLNTEWGKIMTAVGIILDIIGSAWILRIMQNSQRA